MSAAAPTRAGVLPASCRDREGAPFTVREVAAADRERLDRFYEAFEPKRAAQGLPPQGAQRIARWLDATLPLGTHLAVESGGELVGHALLSPTGREGVAEYAVFLDRSLRGRGMGTEVNRIAAEVARERGLRKLWLTVEPHNRAAIRSYEKAGYRFLPETIYSPEAEMEMEL